MTSLQIGDRVRIISYGHRMWVPHDWIKKGWISSSSPILNKTETHTIVDTAPELVGQEGVIVKIDDVQGTACYALQGPSKHAWYSANQLELIKPHPPQ